MINSTRWSLAVAVVGWLSLFTTTKTLVNSSLAGPTNGVRRMVAPGAARREREIFDPLELPAAAMRLGDHLARDNKIDDLFFDQLQQQQQQQPPKTTTTTKRHFRAELNSDPSAPLYGNTINLDNSLEEDPEMFTNNHHQSASASSLLPPELASSVHPPSSSQPTPAPLSGHNPRHYYQLGSGIQKGSYHHQQQFQTQNVFLNNHQHQHSQGYAGHKYPPNMFANNYNLNYIHSFLSPSKPLLPAPSGNSPSGGVSSLLNIPDLLLNSSPSRLSTYGGGGSGTYVSASSALSAAVNSIQLQSGMQAHHKPNQYSSGLAADNKPGQASEQPAAEAAGHTPASERAPVNASIGQLPGSAVCGRQQVAAYREPRVVGGNNTYEGEFPWAVSIQRHGNHHCGGVIVGRRWILTAAHCVRSQLVGNLVVRTGGHTLSRSANSLNGHMEKDYQVEQIVMHDDFSRYDNLTISQLKSSANTNNADIALLKLRHEIHWNELAWPVCFPNREAGNFSGHDATVIGWGKLNEKSEEFSNELQKVKLTIIDNKVCQNWFRQAGRDMPIDDRIICAGFKSGGKDACHGDSGGPLLSRINGQYVVVGVVSTGIGCARPLLPGLYSRVSSYINWIERYITS